MSLVGSFHKFRELCQVDNSQTSQTELFGYIYLIDIISHFYKTAYWVSVTVMNKLRGSAWGASYRPLNTLEIPGHGWKDARADVSLKILIITPVTANMNQ